MSERTYAASERSRVRRHPERGSHDRTTIDAILDEGLVCHVGIVVDGRPVVIPMAYARDGGRLLLHGAGGGRLMLALAAGADVCVTVTLLDGVVVAHSAFDSSMNYRSVIAFGRSRRVVGVEEKRRALDVLTDHLIPGRTREIRRHAVKEIAATEVVEVVIEEASAKARSGPPAAPARPVPGDVWMGVVPLRPIVADPIPAAGTAAGREPPASVRALVRRLGARPARRGEPRKPSQPRETS